MDAGTLKTLKLAVPFQPFYVTLKDNRRILVEQPHQIAVAPDGSRVGVDDRTGVVLVRPEEVKAVDVLAPVKQH
ncbi:MAG TPA: hypothetical protein VH518_09310 [Tepidisphaeraceae bacterium]